MSAHLTLLACDDWSDDELDIPEGIGAQLESIGYAIAKLTRAYKNTPAALEAVTADIRELYLVAIPAADVAHDFTPEYVIAPATVGA